MVMMAMALVGAGLSLIGDASANKKAKKQAKKQVSQAWQNANIQMNGLAEAGDELNKEVALELLNKELDGLKGDAKTANHTVESGVAGNNAMRLYNSTEMEQTLYTNQVAQRAESAMMDVQRNMTATTYEYENKVQAINDNLAGNTKSGADMATGAVGAFASGGGSMGSFKIGE